MCGEENSWDHLDYANQVFMDEHWVCHHGELDDAGDFVEKGSKCHHCGAVEECDDSIDPGFFWEELHHVENK